MLSMDVGNEMLGTLGEIHHRFQINDLTRGSLDGGKLLCQQSEIMVILGCERFQGQPAFIKS